MSVSMPRPAAASAPSPKRRKLRKGTQSCWECKRRKAKCTFPAHTRDVCDGCKRRGTDCISQETTEKPPSPRSNRHLVDRLGHVEASVRQLLQAVRHDEEEGTILPTSSGIRQRTAQSPLERSELPTGHARIASNAYWSAAEGHGSPEDTSTEVPSQHPATSLTDSWPDATSDEAPLDPQAYEPLSRNLLAAWPNIEDMDIILQVPIESSESIRAVTGSPPKDTDHSPPESRILLQLPGPGCHPVLIARKMITLAIVLQTIPASSAKHLDEKLSIGCQDVMSRLVKTARDLVTRDDDLVSSLGGLECLMLEGLYENHLGNFRRSWLTTRRSVMIAQMLGLNRGIAPPSVGDDSVDPEDLWFRIVSFDRYLCLMLGLPQSSSDEALACADILKSCPANTRMQRLCSVASGLLLNRNAANLYEEKLNAQIDEILRDASTSMPAQWWVTPGLAPDDCSADAVRVTLRSNDQVMQYHLLLQLHLPYLLCPWREDGWNYHRMVVVTASREILTRFLNLHRGPKARHYCRGIDLIAFLSCAALSLIHILCEHRHDTIEGRSNYFLAHQRLSDRGLMEQAMAIAEEGVRESDDNIFKRLKTLLRCMFAFEDDVAAGFRYTASFMPELAKEPDLGHQIHASEDGQMALVHLPHLPVIKIERQGSQETQEKDILQTCSLEYLADPPLLPIDWRDGATGEAFQNILLNGPISLTMDDQPLDIQSSQNGLSASEEYWMTDSWGLEGVDVGLLEPS